MNKKKFQKKGQELAEYEDEVLKQAKNFFDEEKQRELEKRGLKGCAYLFWFYREDIREDETILERIPFTDSYTCHLYITICKKEDDPYDLDLESVSIIQTITMIGRPIFFPVLRFKKFDVSDCMKEFAQYYDSVIENGYEATFNKI